MRTQPATCFIWSVVFLFLSSLAAAQFQFFPIRTGTSNFTQPSLLSSNTTLTSAAARNTSPTSTQSADAGKLPLSTLFDSLFNSAEGQDFLRELDSTFALVVKNNTDASGNIIQLQGSGNSTIDTIKQGLADLNNELNRSTNTGAAPNNSARLGSSTPSPSSNATTLAPLSQSPTLESIFNSNTNPFNRKEVANGDLNNRINSVVNSSEMNRTASAFDRLLGLFR